MRRNVGIALLVVMVVLAAADASAQRLGEPQDDTYLRIPHRFTVFLDAGIGVPTQPGPFRDSWNTTFPVSAGIGYSVLGWMDINFLASYASFSFVGVSEITGGSIKTVRYMGTARFIAAPSQQFNVYAEAGAGYFSTSAEDLEITGREPNNPIEQSWTNTMDAVSGLAILIGVGGQYALNERWSAYTEFTWNINQNGDFAPSNLLLAEDEERSTGDGSLNMAVIAVGIMIRL
jgi:hypothetical protein